MPRLRTRPVPASLLTLAVVLTFVTASLMPLGLTRAPAAAQPLCLGETVWEPERQECVALEDEDSSVPPVPSDIPSTASTVTPTPAVPSEQPLPSPPSSDEPVVSAAPSAGMDQLPPDAGLVDIPALGEPAVYVYASFYTCQEGPDWYAFAADRPVVESQMCLQPATPNLPLQVWIGDDLIAMSDTSGGALSDGGAYAQLQPLPAGDLTLVSQPPRGFGTPVVYCSVWDVSSDRPREPARPNQLYPATPDGAITIPDVELDQSITCQWNNVLTDASAELTIRGYQCPAGYDPYGVQPATLRTECPFVTDGREFLIAGPDEFRTGITNETGNVALEDLVPGLTTIIGFQPGPEEAPLVYCEMTGPDGQTFSGYDYQIPASTNSIAYMIEPLSDLHCDWFFVATGDSLEAPGASPSGNQRIGIPPIVRASGSPSPAALAPGDGDPRTVIG